jgi:thiaminase/transcriptional activator TenA
MKTSDNLRQSANAIYQRIFEHPFVTGIGDGTLEIVKFRYYIEQDYLYLIEYSRVLALAVARANDIPTMSRFASLLNETLNSEMELHRSYAEQFNINRASLESVQPSPTTQSYTNHLLTTAYTNEIPGIAAALVPCQLGYNEIGQILAGKGMPLQQPLYCQWIEMYTSQEFTELAEQLKQVVDTVSEGLGTKGLAQMEKVFLTSARYEYLFWDAAWRLEQWIL